MSHWSDLIRIELFLRTLEKLQRNHDNFKEHASDIFYTKARRMTRKGCDHAEAETREVEEILYWRGELKVLVRRTIHCKQCGAYQGKLPCVLRDEGTTSNAESGPGNNTTMGAR